MSDKQKETIFDKARNVGDTIGDCTQCRETKWGSPSGANKPFVCNECAISFSSISAHAHTTNPDIGFVGDVHQTCAKCNKQRWGKDGTILHVCNSCANRTNPVPKPLSPHYAKLAIDPYEYAHRNGLGMLQGNVVKYVTRYKDKNGKEDLEKAMNTLQRLIDMEYPK